MTMRSITWWSEEVIFQVIYTPGTENKMMPGCRKESNGMEQLLREGNKKEFYLNDSTRYIKRRSIL